MKKQITLLLFFTVIIYTFLVPQKVCSTSDELQESLAKLGYTSFKLKRNVKDEFEVNAKINNKQDVLLIIDFQWSHTIFDKKFMKDNGIEIFKTGQKFRLNKDEEESYAATIETVNIGDAVLNAMDVVVIDFEEFDALEYSKAKGILGRDFLLKHAALVDYGNQVLYLKTK